MPRFEFSEGTSNKFWEIELSGDSFTTRWGRIGTEGQSKTKAWDSAATAKKEYDKLVASKLKEGYEQVDGGAEGEDDDGDGGGAVNEGLEGKIAQALDDPQGYAVYADWLQQQGDVRGKLITLQLAATQKDDAAAFRAAEKLLTENAEALWGEELAEQLESGALSADWRWGFVRKLFVGQKDYDQEVDPGELLDKALDRPCCRFVREVVIGLSDLDSGQANPGTAVAVLARRKPASVSSLFLMDFEYPDETEISWSNAGDLGALWKALPQLTQIRLRTGAEFTLGALHVPNVRQFTLETGGLDAKNFKRVVDADWPALERLEVWFGQDNYGGTCTANAVATLLARTDLPKLVHLGLRNAEFTNELIPLLERSPVLKQLKTLDLSMGCLTDEGARALVEHQAAFAHLSSLDVSQNGLSDDGQRLVAKVAKKVEVGSQREFDDDDSRYTAVGE